MGTIRKLPSGNYQARINSNGSNLSKTFRTMDEAQGWISEIEKPLLSTVEQLSEIYLDDVMIRDGKERGSYLATKFRLKTIDRTINGKPLEKLTRDDVVAYRQKRVQEVSGSTVRLELQLLSRLLRWAADEQGVECTDVVAGVKLPDAGKPRSKIIEKHEYEMILDKTSEKSKDIIILAWETAMRRNEILSITPSMVDLRKKVIHLSDEQTKNGEGRDVPLSSIAIELLKRLCDGREKDKHLFTLTPYAVTQAFRRAARLSLVHGVCFHSLRHTAITRYAEKGFNTIQLQCISGHKSITMLARYTHIKATTVAELMD